MNSKQRAVLRSKASGIDAIFQIGKGGVTDNMLSALSDALDKRELIKITVLKNAENTPRELMDILCERLDAQPVAVIGGKVIIYRFSKTLKEHIEF